MSEPEVKKVYDGDFRANKQQNTPNITDLEAQLQKDSDDHEAAKAAARLEPDPDPTPIREPEEEHPSSDPPEDDQPKPEPKDDPEELKAKLARYNASRRLAEREAKRYQEENARLRGALPALTPSDEQERLINERATVIAAQAAFNREAQKVLEAGKKEFPDFELSIANFKEINGITNEIIEAAMESGPAHQILHYLSNNLDEAERLKTLPSYKMGAAIERIAATLHKPEVKVAPKTQSKAPPPIKPIAGNNRAEVSLDKMPIGQFMREQDEHDRNRGRRMGR